MEIDLEVIKYTIENQQKKLIELQAIKEKSVDTRIEITRLNACIVEFQRYIKFNKK